jgi:hypothetical protein
MNDQIGATAYVADLIRQRDGLLGEVDVLNKIIDGYAATVDERDRQIEEKTATINECLLLIHEASERDETLNRVVGRLLSGWTPEVMAVQQWFRTPRPNRQRGEPMYETEPMSDADADVVRPHLETS